MSRPKKQPPFRRRRAVGPLSKNLQYDFVEPSLGAELDDMALLRLLALSGHGLALVPSMVVERELQTRPLRTLIRVPKLGERFYAITLRRLFEDPQIERVVAEFRARLKAIGGPV